MSSDYTTSALVTVRIALFTTASLPSYERMRELCTPLFDKHLGVGAWTLELITAEPVPSLTGYTATLAVSVFKGQENFTRNVVMGCMAEARGLFDAADALRRM